MTDTPSNALKRIVVFAVLLLIAGRNRFPYIFVAYMVYRLLNTDFGKRAAASFKRDMRGLMLLITVKREINKRLKANEPLHKIFLEKVKAHPTKTACIEVEGGKEVTYQQLNQLANKFANLYQADGYKKGDVVALFMENSIDFFAMWLGLSKIGVVSAFINSNLKLDPLAHSINVSNCKSIVTTTTLLPTLQAAINDKLISADIPIKLTSGVSDELDVLHKKIDGVSSSEPDSRGIDFHDVLCYIYTSGTTGNPKPAVIKHFRYYWMSMGSANSFGITSDDIIYITMPMYHSAAGILGIGSIISKGTTAVIRKKFSATNFWKDCIKYNCTGSQYIGEICRYLLAQKPSDDENKHRVRLMWGNGLRPELWTDFVTRFNIAKIGELYGSTEGNSNIVNIDNKVGACGFMPIYPHIGSLYPVRLIKVDMESGELVRGKDGLCVPCKPGETGEMVGVIKSKDVLLKFEGYVNKGDTEKKIYEDVFVRGDKCFASGDILHWDELGYLYFKDRRGDTFRWKGENVSTTEVESILQPMMEVEDATVYGVEVGKLEGRAGMAGVVLANGANVESFIKEINVTVPNKLPPYAMPLFVRICKEVDRTGTFKLKKTNLQKEGFNLEQCKSDLVFYWNAAEKSYKTLDKEMQTKIDNGEYTRF